MHLTSFDPFTGKPVKTILCALFMHEDWLVIQL